MKAIKATFSDFKLIKTRKVAQIVLEVPIEAANAALQSLGGVPQFDAEQWVAVAPLDPDAAPEPAPEPPKREMTMPQWAGMMCNDERFQRFLGIPKCVGDADATASALRLECGVNSRADIKGGTPAGERFRMLMTDFDAEIGRISKPR